MSPAIVKDFRWWRERRTCIYSEEISEDLRHCPPVSHSLPTSPQYPLENLPFLYDVDQPLTINFCVNLLLLLDFTEPLNFMSIFLF